MLSPRVVDAVSQGRFHVYTADMAGDGMELLTGRNFGTLSAGGYPPDTVLGCAQRTLHAYREACQTSGTRRQPSDWPRGPNPRRIRPGRR